MTISSSEILNATILIVDDLPANVRLLENMLHGAGYARIASTMDPPETEMAPASRENSPG